MAALCSGCDKKFRGEDLAPYQRNADGMLSKACRFCIDEWISLGILWNRPFWARKSDA